MIGKRVHPVAYDVEVEVDAEEVVDVLDFNIVLDAFEDKIHGYIREEMSNLIDRESLRDILYAFFDINGWAYEDSELLELIEDRLKIE